MQQRMLPHLQHQGQQLAIAGVAVRTLYPCDVSH